MLLEEVMLHIGASLKSLSKIKKVAGGVGGAAYPIMLKAMIQIEAHDVRRSIDSDTSANLWRKMTKQQRGWGRRQPSGSAIQSL